MLTDVTAVRSYFGKLGLEQEIADLYLALYSNGPQNISALSRNSGVERTRIYRLIDKLLASNLIELESGSKRGIIKAAPIANLRILINQRQQELKNLTDELELMEQVMSRNSLSYGHSRIQFFSGSEGIRQMLRRELETKTDIIGYQVASFEPAVGKQFLDEHDKQIKERHIVCRLERSTARNAGLSCHIYDDVVAYIFTSGELYGFEVHDQLLADDQRYSLTDTSRQNAT